MAEVSCILRRFIIRVRVRYYQDDQIEEGEMGGALSTHGRNEKYIQEFGRKK
jgi:hypothetical protein